MKADRLLVWLAGIGAALALLLQAEPAFASRDRSITIDARRGVSTEVVDRYRQAALGSSRAPYHRVRIRPLIAAGRGFPAEVLRLPRSRRFHDVTVVLVVTRGNTITREITVNAFEIDDRRARLIRQATQF
jgi:hypothetical protein